MVCPFVSSQPRVSWKRRSPRASASVWRATSNSMARSRDRNELRFLTSTLVPNVSDPTGRMETLPSMRMLPASMSAFEAPM